MSFKSSFLPTGNGIDKLFGIPKTDLVVLTLWYTISHGGILLLVNAIYWDGWVLWNVEPQVVLDTFRQAGAFLNIAGYVHVVLLAIGPWIYRILTILMTYISGIFLWHILARQTWISSGGRFLITLFFLTTPLNIARVSLVNFPSTFFLFVFFLAWLMIERQPYFSLFLFFLSFSNQALLFFYALPILERFLLEEPKRDLKHVVSWTYRHLHFVSAPIIFLALKMILFRAYGLYGGYNEQFDIRNLILSPIRQLFDFINFEVSYIVIFVVFMLILRIRWSVPKIDFSHQRALKYFIVGSLALVAALFPYWVLGHVPTFVEWTSRHQLLMPLGIALICIGLLALTRPEHQRAIVALLLSFSIVVNINNYLQLSEDWYKQKAIATFLSQSDEIQAADVVAFTNNTKNALGRSIRFYEWTGLLKWALNDESRMALNESHIGLYFDGYYDRYFLPHYNLEGHVRLEEPKIVNVIIDRLSITDMVRQRKLYDFQTKSVGSYMQKNE